MAEGCAAVQGNLRRLEKFVTAPVQAAVAGSAERDLGVLVGSKLTMNQRWALMVPWTAWEECPTGGQAPPLSPSEALGCCVLRDTDLVERIQPRAIEVMKGLEHLPQERLREPGVLSEEEKAQGRTYQCI